MSNPTPPVTSIRGLAERIAAYRALDLLLFEHIGRWITTDPDGATAGLRPYAAAWSQHHSWHAELWSARFPSIPDGDVDAATETARPRLAGVEEAFAAASITDGVALLAHVVLPQLAVVLREHRASVDVDLDAPTARVLDLVLTDLERDRAAAEQLAAANGRAGAPSHVQIDLAAALVGH